jgi:O2-independent ubiquinone biosynthesis accessory factor UbiT
MRRRRRTSRAMDFPPFPFPLRRLAERLPSWPPAAVAALAVNVWFGAALNARKLPAALGKIVAIHVRDVGLRLAFRIEEDGVLARGDVHADATISADARDFLALARREEDPDTLFFSRRLLMEGDTELALLVKNTLDSLDFRALGPPPPARVLSALGLQMRALL